MVVKLLAALRVFIRSLLGDRSAPSLPEPAPLTPTVAERFGKPLPHPRLEIATPLAGDECIRRLRSALGRGTVDIEPEPPRAVHPRDPVPLRLRMTGSYRLPGPLQRQVLAGEIDPSDRGTRLTLRLAPRSDGAALGQLISSVLVAVFVSFVFLTWITGPAGISLWTVAALSVVVGAITGPLAQGVLNLRGNLKERRRLARTAARLAMLLEGAVVEWP